MRKIDFTAMTPAETYHWFMSAVVPRPIAYVTSLGPDGVVNAAPFSSFVVLSITPPIAGFVVGSQLGYRKDTLNNIERVGEYVINTVPEGLAQQVQDSARTLPASVSEVEEAGLATIPAEVVSVPRIAESPVHLECRLHDIVEFGDAPDRLIAGEVVSAHVRDDLMREMTIDIRAYSPLGRIGGRTYCRIGELIEV